MVITYSSGSNPARTFATDTPHITVGRFSPNSSVDLDLNPDLQVSHVHARITYGDEVYWIEDLGSRNGTWVNGRRIDQKTPFGVDDTLRVGQTTLRIQPTPGAALRDYAAVGAAASPDSSALTSVIDSGKMASELIILPAGGPGWAGLSAEALRERLAALYDLGAALSTIDTLEPMLAALLQFILRAIPTAERGAVLLREGEELLLKAHMPPGRPSASLTLAREATDRQQGFIWRSTPEERGDPSESVLRFETQCALYAPLVRLGEVLGVVCVESQADASAFAEEDLRLLIAMANHAALFVKHQILQSDLRRETAMRANLLRQFSPRVADRLLRDSAQLRLGGERANPVTILIADVRGFTALAAQLEPDDAVQMLNGMFSVLIPILFKFDGTVDKYTGDGLLAVFGSPEPDDQQCEKAVRAAVEMQQAMTKLAEVWKLAGVPTWELGIGIHTGAVVHGFIGSQERVEYTVIGDTVNRAARHCDGAGPGEILLSNTVYERVYRLVSVEPRAVPSKHPDTEPDLHAYKLTALL